jgi:SAM-dependent methyltransferase
MAVRVSLVRLSSVGSGLTLAGMAVPSPSAPAAGAGPRTRTAVRTAVVWDYLRAALHRLDPAADGLRVLDAGGGSGGFAVPLAQLGHTVTVVDPSPDSLAALERRVAESGTAQQVRAVQGDAAGLPDLVPAGAFDVVLCHSVLEVVDDPLEAVQAIGHALRPGGVASVLTVNRIAAVLSRVAAGRLGEARRLLADPDGSTGAGDPLARRFTLEELELLLSAAGLRPRTVHGVRVFADTVPAALLDGDAHALDDLLALERAAAERPAYLAVATQLHVLADRG